MTNFASSVLSESDIVRESFFGGYVLIYSRERGDKAPWEEWAEFSLKVERAMHACNTNDRQSLI